MSDPRFGVYLPSYNMAHLVRRAVESVLAQTLQDFQLLILDDASRDDTERVIEPFLADPRVSYVRHPENLGMARNWNYGIDRLQNPYVAKLDADDEWEPTYLSTAVAAFDERPDVGFFFSANWVERDGERRLARPFTSSFSCDGLVLRRALMRRNFLYSPTISVRREVLQQVGGFRTDLWTGADFELWTRVISSTQVAYSPEPLAVYHRHPGASEEVEAGGIALPNFARAWTELLDSGTLPYRLTDEEHEALSARLLLTCHDLMQKAVLHNQPSVADASWEYLRNHPLLPISERFRLRVLRGMVNHRVPLREWLSRGSTWLWNKNSIHQLRRLHLPAQDPSDALPAARRDA